MDVFKLAFETTIVGLLTLGWLAVATYLLSPDVRIDSVVQMLPDLAQKNLTTVGVGVLILAYCLGSAILPISNQLVNDEHWPLNENAIRCQVFTKYEFNLESIRETALSDLPKEETFSLTELRPHHCSYWAPVFTKRIRIQQRVHRFLLRWIGLPPSPGEDLTEKSVGEIERICRAPLESTACDEFKAERILTIFLQQETAVLSQASGRTERLRQLHERIVVLRGTIFSLYVLLLICLFAYFARVDGKASHWIRPTCGVLLGVAFAVFAIINGYHDLEDPNIFDIPVLEGLLVVITLFGVALAVRRTKHERFQSKRYVLVTLFFTALAYGGWLWSEVIYDQEVISSYVVLRTSPPTSK